MRGFKKKAFVAVSATFALAFCILSAVFFVPAVGTVSAEDARDDSLYYRPSSFQSAGWWEGLKVEEGENGTHVSFTDCTYVTIRTTSSVCFSSDDLHLKIKNFKGDGICIAFSSMQSPDAYDPALRFFAFNRADYTGVMRWSCPTWGSLSVFGTLDARPVPSSFDVRLRKNEDGSRDFIFNGQTFNVAEDVFLQGVSDPDRTYVSFSAYGGTETINTYTFDLAAIHDGNSRCAGTLGEEEIALIGGVERSIGEIGKTEVSEECRAKIEKARQNYDRLSSELKKMVRGYDTLRYAEQNYYVLTHEPQFDESNVVSSMIIASDNHIDTNDCTNYEDGSPQDRFDAVLRYASEKKADAMLLIGDMTDWARFDQTEDLRKARYQINLFKDSVQKNLVGVPLFFTFGNHDSSESEGDSRVDLFREILGESFYANDVNRAEEEWAKGCRHAVISGYDFISLEWDYTGERQNISSGQLDWLEKTLKTIVSDPQRDRSQPLFVLSHVPFSDTVYGSGNLAESPNKQRLYSILAGYPEIVLLTGHSHFPLNNQTFVYQSDFTHIACSSTAYLDMDGAGYLTEGGYLSGDSLIPYGHTTSQAIYLEIDGRGNIRITRLDMSEGGKQILDKVIVPAADPVGKTHLNYYTNARAYRYEAPEFDNGGALEVCTSYEDAFEVSFDTVLTENAVQYYEITAESDKGVRVYRSYANNWMYPRLEDMPERKTVRIDGETLTRPYRVSVVAVDSYGLRSREIVAIAVRDDEADAAAAERTKALISAIGEVNEESGGKIEAAKTAYDGLPYEVKRFVDNASVLEEAVRKYSSLFVTLEEYYNMAKTGRTVVGNNYWADTGELNYYNSGKGLQIEYRNAMPNVRVGLRSFDLDGLHLRFDGLEKTDDMPDGSYPAIGFILGGTEHPMYTEPVKTGILLFLDTATGKLECHPGFRQVVKDPALTYEKLKEGKWDVRFSVAENGDLIVEIAGKKGSVDASYFDGSFTLTDLSDAYLSISCWVDRGSFDLRLLAAHDGESECRPDEKISFALINEIVSLDKEIGKLGKITEDSLPAIERAEKRYAAVPDKFKSMVTNAAKLTAAREEYERLTANGEEQSSGQSSVSSGSEKRGCKGMLGNGALPTYMLSAYAMILSSVRNKKSKRGQKNEEK